MSQTTIEILPDNLLEHQAARAWGQLGNQYAELDSIEILKHHRKTAVYRLAGPGSVAATVIAKRCYTRTAEVEQIVYQQLLPRVGLPALRCYGFIKEPAGDYSWLFLEDAQGLEYSSASKAHCVLAGKWLAAMESAALDSGRLPGLPDRDCSYYRDELRFVAARLPELLANPVLPADDRSALRALASQCDVLAGHWAELEAWCGGFPRTLVHGDFAAKNLRVCSTPVGAALLVFDWEVAGWGIPATDLAQSVGWTVSPNLLAYQQALADLGLPLEKRLVERVAQCGSFFRMLDIIAWACQWGSARSYVCLSKPVSCLRLYGTRLAHLFSSVGWAN